MISFDSAPLKQLDNLQICTVNGLFNPYIFQARRKDFNIIDILDLTIIGGDHTVTLQTSDLLNQADIGDTVYVNSGDYDQTTVIVGIGIASFTCVLDGTGNTVGGYCNLKSRTNWFLQLEITTLRPTKVFTSKYREAIDGSITMDVSSILRGLMSFADEFAYDVTNQADLNLSRIFKFRHKEVYTGQQGTYTSFNAFFYAVVNGAKQLGAVNGSNYLEFYPGTTDITAKAKFLTMFEKPVWWKDYPFDLQFIYPGKVFTTQDPVIVSLIRRQVERNINGDQVIITEADLDNSLLHVGYVNRLMMRTTGSYGNPDTVNDVRSVLVSVRLDDYGSEDYGDNLYADDYWATLAPPDPGEFDITEALEVELKKDCVDNPFYIKWLHSLGGWDYWMFDRVQFFERSIFDSERYQSVVTDIETATSREDFVGKKARNEVSVGVNGLSTQQMRALEDLLSSPKVYRLDTDVYDSTDITTIKWQVIKLKTGSFKTVQTSINKHDLECEFELQELYLQSNI